MTINYKLHRYIKLVITILITLTLKFLFAQTEPPRQIKYIISDPYAEPVSGDWYTIKINYYRYYNVVDEFDDYFYNQKLGVKNYSDFRLSTMKNHYKFLYGKDMSSPKAQYRMHQFSNEDPFPVTVGGKTITIKIDQDIHNMLNGLTDNITNNISTERHGVLPITYLLRMKFEPNIGKTTSEIDAVYQNYITDYPEWIAEFNKLINLFEDEPLSVLNCIGFASPSFEGEVDEADESNFDLAGLRAAAGVNFFMDKYNELKSGNLTGNTQYNKTTNTISASGAGTTRLLATNGGIRDTKTNQGYYNDQTTYFVLRIY